MPKVVLFSTSTCSWCRRAKRYFKEHGVPFKEINVERDQQAARDIARKTGQTGVPVIKIGSAQGFVRATGDLPNFLDTPAGVRVPRLASIGPLS